MVVKAGTVSLPADIDSCIYCRNRCGDRLQLGLEVPEADSPYRMSIKTLLQRKESITRIIEYWVDQEPRRERLRCVFERNGFEAGVPKITERCESLYRQLTFENDYFLNADGHLAGSRQWFHPEALPIEIDHRQQVAP
jgi:hypothetical protein